MENLLCVPQGSFVLQRLPLRKLELLKPWDAADEYLLQYLAEQEGLSAERRLVILNDSFGALAVALHVFRPLALSDSFLSQQATRLNLEANAVEQSRVVLQDSLTPLAADIDYLLIKVPKTLALLEDQLFRLRPFLKPNSRIIAAGMIKNMPATVWKILERLVGPTTTSLAVKKARLIFTTLDAAIKLPANPYPISYLLENSSFRLWNHANVFSRDSLDIGARFFLQHLPNNPAYKECIDLGCGNGVLGLMWAAEQPGLQLTFVDESFMAIASARQNFEQAFAGQRQAEFVVSDGLSGFARQSVDCIICNPPFHQQQTLGDQVASQMFRQALEVLRPGGELRVIGNRHLGYGQSLKKLFGNCRHLAGNAKFDIFSMLKR